MAGVAGRQVEHRLSSRLSFTSAESPLLAAAAPPAGETSETAAVPSCGPAARLLSGAAGSGEMCRSRQDIHISAFLLESCCPAVPLVTVFPEMLSLATGQQNPALGHSGEILYTCKIKCFM